MSDPLGLFSSDTQVAGGPSGDPLGLFDAASEKKKDPLQLFSGDEVGQGLRSAADAGLSMISGLPSMIAGGLAGAGSFLTNGFDVNKAADVSKAVQDSNFGAGTPTPFTKGGKQAQADMGKGMEDLASSAGMAAYKAGGGEAGRANAEFATNALLNLLGGEGGVETLHTAVNHPDVVAGKKSVVDQIADIQKKQADAEALQTPSNAGAPEVSPDLAGDRAWTDVGAQLVQGQSDTLPTRPDPMASMANDLSQAPARDAQAAIDARQAQMEQEIKQRQTLDFNAAERARQENAPTGYTDWLQSQVDEKYGRQLRADYSERLNQAQGDAQGPVYVDPQGQAFRGDPGAPDARAGLDAQTTAMDRELTHLRGKNTPEGEPLRPLQDPDLNDSRAAAQAVLQQIADREKQQGLAGKPISSKGKGGRQRGAVDLSVLKDGFEKIKDLANGIRLKASGSDRGLTIEAHTREGHKIGFADLSPEYVDRAKGDERDLVSGMTMVHPDFQGTGLSKEIYKFASELGNDISPSKIQSEAGKRMWENFKKNGTAENGKIPQSRPRPPSPGNRQTGGIFLNNFMKKTDIAKDAERFINGQEQRYGSIPTDRPVEDTIKQARAEPDGRGWNYLESGGILTAMKRASTAVGDGVRTVQNAIKRGDWQINQFVHPVERAVKGLSGSERSLLWHGVLKDELLNNKKYDPNVLGALPVKVQAAYAHFRRMFDDTLDIQNEQRRSEGKPEITPLEAYVASRWSGDYRRPIFQAILDKGGNPVLDAEGNIQRKLVWYLAGENKFDLDRQTKALKAQFPDLMHDPERDHTAPGYLRKTDMQSAYTRALDILGRDDPAVQKLKEAAESEMTNQSANFLSQTKHFEPKAGIRGFVGDRPGREGRSWYGSDKSASEALAGMQQQINYGKNAYRWAEIQKAGDGIKQIVNDPVLSKEQPNNIKYLREYYKNALGFGQNAALAALTQNINHGLGFNPRSIGGIIANSKSFFILQKLSLNAKTSIMHMLQSANVFPHLTNNWIKEGGHDPVTSYAVGFPAGVALATKHYGDFLTGKGPGDTPLSAADRGFFQRAFKYAEDNMVTTHTIYQEAPIEKKIGLLAQTGNAMGHALGVPETLSRSVAFMSLVHSLRGSEKFKGNEAALFQKAEELTYAAMGDYRSGERALAFHKAGAVGNALNTLQTYPMNQIHQYGYFARQAIKGNVAPLMTMLAVQYTMAGIMGLPVMDDFDKLYKFAKDHIIPDKAYINAEKSEFWSDPKLWALHHWGTDVVDGWVSAKTGLGISSSLRSAMPTDMVRAPGAPYADMAKQAYNVGNAAISPVANGRPPFSNKTLNAQVAMSSLPSGAAQGNFEQSQAMEGTTWNKKVDASGKEVHVYERPANLMSRTGVAQRSPDEEMLRRFGLRSERETMEREVGYRENESNQVAKERADGNGGVTDRFYDAIRRGDKEQAADLFKAHVELTGEPISQSIIQQKVMKEFTTGTERAVTGAKTPTQILNAARMMSLIEQIRKEQGYGNK